MSVNGLSTKVLIQDMIFTSPQATGDGTATPHVVIRATQRSGELFASKVCSTLFSVILRPVVLALGIESKTFRSAVKRVDCKTVVFSSKSVKKSVSWVRLFRARSSRAWNALRACQARDCFQPRSRHFVWLPTRIWIREKTDCFAVYQARHRLS